MKLYSYFFLLSLSIFSCGGYDTKYSTGNNKHDTSVRRNISIDTVKVREVTEVWNYSDTLKSQTIKTAGTDPGELVSYAQSLTGIPYKYASIDPAQGFDCSGFITFVFNHFGIAVPRSSRNFTNVERTINLKESKPGDLILFTGTDSTIRKVGHMGIISSNNSANIEFIHSTSGKAYGVTTTPLNKYYQGRYVKTLRIFPSNN